MVNVNDPRVQLFLYFRSEKCISNPRRAPSSERSGVINTIRGPSKPISERPKGKPAKQIQNVYYIASGHSHTPVE